MNYWSTGISSVKPQYMRDPGRYISVFYMRRAHMITPMRCCCPISKAIIVIQVTPHDISDEFIKWYNFMSTLIVWIFKLLYQPQIFGLKQSIPSINWCSHYVSIFRKIGKTRRYIRLRFWLCFCAHSWVSQGPCNDVLPAALLFANFTFMDHEDTHALAAAQAVL